MTQSTVFKTNRTQAVRIPKALAFPEHVKKVNVVKQGENLLIVPVAVAGSWVEFFNGPRLDEDFGRPPQPPPQERDFDS